MIADASVSCFFDACSEKGRQLQAESIESERHSLGKVLAVVELVSPGNKDTRHALRSFVEKTVNLLYDNVNLLIIDPFPPGPRDPQGIHKTIWNEITAEPFELPAGRNLTLVAYQAARLRRLT